MGLLWGYYAVTMRLLWDYCRLLLAYLFASLIQRLTVALKNLFLHPQNCGPFKVEPHVILFYESLIIIFIV